jgi:hypothetical protein
MSFTAFLFRGERVYRQKMERRKIKDLKGYKKAKERPFSEEKKCKGCVA